MTIPNVLQGSAVDAARRLLGYQLVRTLDGQMVSGRIVETEAYDQTDAASHSYRGRTPRTDVMFGPSGHLYVYFTYGMHYCCNVTVGPKGVGAAVLIRAIEPLEGDAVMRRNRGSVPDSQLTNGPAKLCQALRIDKTMNGHELTQSPLRLVSGEPVGPDKIVQTTRIGISKEADKLWRFFVKDNPYVSRPA